MFSFCVFRIFWSTLFVNSWILLLDWGAAVCVVLILELHLVCLPVFGCVDRLRDVSDWTSDIGRGSYFYSSSSTSYAWRSCVIQSFFRVKTELYDVIFEMSWSSWHQVVLFSRGQAFIFLEWRRVYCIRATCEELLDSGVDGFLATVLMVKDNRYIGCRMFYML